MPAQADQHGSDSAPHITRKLFGRDSVYVALWTIQIVLAAVLTPVTTRLLPASEFGLMTSCTAIMEVLYVLAAIGLQVGVQRVYADDDGAVKARAVVGLGLLSATATFVIFYLTGRLWSDGLGLTGFPSSVRYAVAWAALVGVTNTGLGLIKSRDQLGWFAAVSLIQSCGAGALAVLMVYFGSRTATTYVLGQTIGQGAAALLTVALTRPRLPRLSELPMIQGVVRFSVGLVPAGLATFVFDSADRLIVRADVGSPAAARYSVARNIGGLTIIMLATLNSVWMPRLFAIKNDPQLRDNVLAASRDGLFKLIPALVLAITSASPIILRIWVPPSYHPDGLLLVTALVAVAAMPAAGAQSSMRILLLADRTGAVAGATVLAGCVNLALNLLLVPPLGIDGSALATFCAFQIQYLIIGLVARRYGALPSPSRRLVFGVILSIGVAIAWSAVPTSLPMLGVRLLFAIGAGAFFIARLGAIVGFQPLALLRTVGARSRRGFVRPVPANANATAIQGDPFGSGDA